MYLMKDKSRIQKPAEVQPDKNRPNTIKKDKQLSQQSQSQQ